MGAFESDKPKRQCVNDGDSLISEYQSGNFVCVCCSETVENTREENETEDYYLVMNYNILRY